ncbi:MAG: alpha/beta hydrolase fold domain-containing protein [Deltaproteobacteria bacterium]|nr:alpha/beta hydrolase fold domain-containing protein [Deltaproteobacteria bacterium]
MRAGQVRGTAAIAAIAAFALLAACGGAATGARDDVAAPADAPVDATIEVEPPGDGPGDGLANPDAALPDGPDDPAQPEPVEDLAAGMEPGDPAADEPAGEPVVDDVPPADQAPADPGPEAFPPPSPVGCVTSVAAGAHQFPCDGLVHDVSVPAQCLDGACGVVLDLHGLTMNGLMQDRNTNLRALGAQHGYVVIQPNANPAPPASSWKTGEDDAKVLAFLDDVQAAFHADPDRVHVTGFSQGGLMTWRFVCKHADRFASAAAGSSCNYPTLEACLFSGGNAPSRRIPLLYMHGKDDIIYLWQAAQAQRDAVIKHWDLQEFATLSSDSHHEWKRYTGLNGALFEFVWHDYKAKSDVLKGHCYPGSTDPGDAPGQLFPFRCDDAAAFAWGEIAMRFFLDHPMGK